LGGVALGGVIYLIGVTTLNVSEIKMLISVVLRRISR